MIKNRFIKSLIAAIYILIIVLACAIPFFFESPSMFYKTGMDKILLRTGKILGILALILMVFQLVFVARFAGLEKIFSLKSLFAFHRKSGILVLTAALLHPIFILGADHFVFFPFEKKYWPEFVGVFLLVGLFLFISISIWQKKTGLTYKNWKWIHKLFAPALLILTAVHVFNVSQSFESGLPFFALSTLLVIAFILFGLKFLKK